MQHVLCSMTTLRQSQAVFRRSVGGTPWKVTVKSVLDPSQCLGPSPSVFPSLWEDCSWRLSSSREGAWYGSCFDLPIGPFAIMIAFNLPCSFTVQANVSLNLQINQELKSVCLAFHTHCLSDLCSLVSSFTNSPPLYPEKHLRASSLLFSVPPGTLPTPPRPTISISVSTCSPNSILLCSDKFQPFLGLVFHLEWVRLLWEITKTYQLWPNISGPHLPPLI